MNGSLHVEIFSVRGVGYRWLLNWYINKRILTDTRQALTVIVRSAGCIISNIPSISIWNLNNKCYNAIKLHA